MRKNQVLIACTIFLAALLAALILGQGAGLAQGEGPIPDARPSPTPDGLVPVAPQPPDAGAAPEIPPLADLIVESIDVTPRDPVLNQEVTIRVTIKNQGTVSPTSTFYTDLYLDPGVVPIQLGQDGIHAWGCQIWFVPPGGSYTLEYTTSFDDVRAYALYAQVDTDNHAPESNENNNILGPKYVTVRAPSTIVHDSHQDFMDGLASTLDISHPEGVIRPGLFMEPSTDPEVYFPDSLVDYAAGPTVPAAGRQSNPALAGDNNGLLFAVWEDGRNGDVYDRDIYFSQGADSNGDGLYEWGPNMRVNNDLPSTNRNQVNPDIVYDHTRNLLYVVWQDGRHKTTTDDNYDIYFRSAWDVDGDGQIEAGEWHGEVRLNTNPTGDNSAQLNPSIALGRMTCTPGTGGCVCPGPWPLVVPEVEDHIYVAWQDRRNGNEDIYLARSDDGGVTWTEENYFVTDDPHMTQQDQVQPSVSVELLCGHVFVGWEDWRDEAHPEVYVMWSWDQGETFDIDTPVTIIEPEIRDTYRRAPAIVADTSVEIVEHEDEFGFPVYEYVPITVVHTAWQEGAGPNPDVYYSYAVYDWLEPDPCPYPHWFCFEDPQEVSGFYIDSAYVRPPEEYSFWPLEPSWQGEVSIDLVPDFQYWTPCLLASGEVYSRGVMIAWSDARPYDDWRYEVRVRRAASPEGDPKQYVVCERPWDQGTVNSNSKLHAYRDDLSDTQPDVHDSVSYGDFAPCATRQANPSLYIDESAIYLAFDDDRWDDPLATGTVRNRDVFAVKAANWNDPAVGVYISPVIPAKNPEPAWYVLSWWGATAHYGDLLLQTRFGTTPNPPLSGEAAVDGTWTAWTGNPSNAIPGCPGDVDTLGNPCYYDAPGRHMVDPNGLDWFGCDTGACPPGYPYMQYRVTMKMNNLYTGRLTALSQVTIHYEGPQLIYLPIVRRNY